MSIVVTLRYIGFLTYRLNPRTTSWRGGSTGARVPSPLAANSQMHVQQHDTGRDQNETEKVDGIRDIEPSSIELEEPPGQVSSHHTGKQDRPDEAANGKPQETRKRSYSVWSHVVSTRTRWRIHGRSLIHLKPRSGGAASGEEVYPLPCVD